MVDIRKVTVLGAGVLGSQIAYQSAFKGFEVTSYDVSEDALAAARDRFTKLAETYTREVPGADSSSVTAGIDRITLTSDLAAAVTDADLVIEAVPEILDLKREIYTKIGELAPESAIFATNSSTLLPSDLKDFTGRPERFLALHFANKVWQFNTAEVMGTADTDPAVYSAVVGFANDIGMVPIELHKEKAGYVLNSLLVPFLNAAVDLVAGGYADPEAVDRTWMVATGAPIGPCRIFDIIGFTTPYNIMSHGDAHAQELAAWLKENYIDKGKLGLASGEGFYRYPEDPSGD
ncbi:MAG: 3-hydroxyacyl-CoA dehydrogenase [Rhodococcus sp.]|uniref:3-hydroxyacyl-CoA dehydrogenase n=1 Tax=Rhodococcus TaxID=1827 RepID=UPI001697FE81|nr:MULTISPECIES: 3-hydroxyacyl-CoA dehydrogenase [Rhodococcus]NLV80415.1 3-hydroxyacyl-CoA dehydrogenase [Rhodococcus sp. (in: high G+C Gram-positive bacteria)]